jgi:hypothetical protein
MTTPNTPVGDLPIPVSPRFGAALPPPLAPPRTPEPDYNPDEFETRTLDAVADTNPDGTPILTEPSHKVTPLDLQKAAQIVEARKRMWDGMDSDEQPYNPEPVWHTIRDSTRKYRFEGVRLAAVSSERGHKTRWTDIEIFRTTGGLFIVHRVGVTTLVHLDDCEQLRKYHKRYTPGIEGIASDEFGPADRQPCPTCKPPFKELLHTEPALLRFERDRHTVSIEATAEGMIQALHTNKDGDRQLGSLAASALQFSADRNPEIASVFYAPPATA